MVERVDIQVTDQVNSAVASKLKEIADQADRGQKNLNSLKQSLSGLNPSALSRLAQANDQAASAALKNQRAAQQSAKAQLDQQRASTSLAQANVRLAQANTQLATSEQKLAQQTANTTRAQNAAALSAVKLQQAQSKLNQQRGGGGGGSGAGALAGAAATAASGKAILEAADSYQRFENRVRSVSNSQAELETAMKKIVDISLQTHIAVDATASLYQRLLPASDRLKVSSDDLWETILNLEKAFATSGATAGETQGAIIQLSQAVGGDFKSSAAELNTILEQSPILAKVLAQQLGTTSDQLKALAKDGQISAKVFFDAFTAGGKGIDELKKRFSTLKPTISQAFQDLTTRATIFIGEIGKATGASDGLSQGIEFLSRHMEILAPLVTGVFAVLIPGLVTAKAAQLLFNSAALKNPYILGFAIFAGAIAALAALYEKNETLRKSINDLAADTATFIGNTILGFAQVVSGLDRVIDAYQFVRNGFSSEGLVPSNLSDPVFDLATAWLESGKNANLADDAFKGLGETIHGVANAGAAAADELDGAGKSARGVGNADFSKTIGGLQQSTTWASRLAGELRNAGIAAQALGANGIRLGPPSAIGGYGVAEPLHKPINSITGKEWSSYAKGGYTGDGGKQQPMGVVHGGEFVIDKQRTSKHRELLEAIHNSPIQGYSSGGTVREPTEFGGYKITRSNGAVNYYTRTGQLLSIDRSGVSSSSGSGGGSYGGLSSWMNAPHIGGTVSQVSLFNQGGGVSEDQLAEMKKWQVDLLNWWTDTKPKLKPKDNVANIGMLVGEWLGAIPKAVTDENYKYDDVRKDLSLYGWAAGVLSGAPPWGETLGKYVKYSGPSYGSSVNFGGDPRDTIDYSLPAAATNSIDSDLDMGIRRVYVQLDPNYKLPDFAMGGMAEGGSFTVPGYGGTDSKRVEMMAMPGETITVDKKGQGEKSVNVSMVVNAKDATSFRKSRNQIIGELQRELSAYQDRN